MTEEQIKEAVAEITKIASEGKGMVLAEANLQIVSDGSVTALLRHDADGEGYAHKFIHGKLKNNAADALASLRERIADLPDAEERKLRAAVVALEAAREACLAINADDVAASLTAAVSRLSEDLIEHKRAQA